MQQAIKGVLAAVMIAGASSAAWAVPATVETDLNIRSGPSTGYAVLDTMPGGSLVDVIACYQGWCEIVWDGLDGFASRAYLDIASGVTIIQPPASAILAPGIVVYETRYFERPIWSSRGHIIRQAIRRDIRRDLRQDRRQEVRQERREDRREIRRDRREDRREVRQDRREHRADRTSEVRRELRRTRQDRADAVRERPRRIEESRRSVERRSTVGSRPRVQQQRVQEQRQQRREVRQERRNEASQARQQRREVRQERRNERRETTGRGGR
jgi:uncharacterized protein YraI